MLSFRSTTVDVLRSCESAFGGFSHAERGDSNPFHAAGKDSRRVGRPELALTAQHAAVGRDYPVYHASRYECSEFLTV